MKQECHLCLMTVQNLAKCTKVRCRNYFCEKCIQENFDSNFTYHACYKDSCWICYACQNLCHCKLCKGELSILGKKSQPRKRKVREQQTAQQTQQQQQQSEKANQREGSVEKDKDSSEQQIQQEEEEDQAINATTEMTNENALTDASSIRLQNKGQQRIINIKISKPLPSSSKEYFINKFLRRRLMNTSK